MTLVQRAGTSDCIPRKECYRCNGICYSQEHRKDEVNNQSWLVTPTIAHAMPCNGVSKGDALASRSPAALSMHAVLVVRSVTGCAEIQLFRAPHNSVRFCLVKVACLARGAFAYVALYNLNGLKRHNGTQPRS